MVQRLKFTADNLPYYEDDGLAADTTAPMLPVEMPTYNDPAPIKSNGDPIGKFISGPANPERPSYMVEPDLMEAQKGMELPSGVIQDELGKLVYKDNNEPVPMVQRPSVLPIAMTPEGPKLSMPKTLDAAGNILGGLVFGTPMKAGEALLGSGMVRKMAANETAPTFYSALEHAVENNPQAKMSGEQWLGTIKNSKGVKPEELEWSGLANFLAEKPSGSNRLPEFTKQEVQDFLQSHKIELKEINKGEYKSSNLNEDKYYKDRETFSMQEFGKEYDHLNDTQQQSIRLKVLKNQNQDPVKFSQYQLPGGENYREMLLALPKEHSSEFKTLQNKIKNNTATGEDYLKWEEIAAKEVNDISKNSFKSSHWDEPNVLAHVRMNDRAIDGKKSLHLEEIQSDWHQKGRNEGYKIPEELKAKADKIDEKLGNHPDAERILGNPDLGAALKEAVDKKIITQAEADTYQKVAKNENSTVPDAPFKKNWHELALKRMIREAAEKGYDRLSWTPGEAQAARYDLSKQVNAIHWQPSPADKNASLVQINPISGDALKLQVDKSGKVVAGFPSSRTNQWEGKNLADVVGKEHAEKILNKTNGSLEGEGLKIGGEGMKGFYDQIIPKALEKIGKEHGVKVKQGTIVKPETKLSYEKFQRRRGGEKPDPSKFEQPIHYIDIPQSLKDTAMKKGFPLFSGGVMLSPVAQNPFVTYTPVDTNPFE